MAKKKQKSQHPVCYKKECGQVVPLAQQLIGKCGKCTHIFCVKHRLPEAHNCDSQVCMSQEEKDSLAASMRCVAAKI